MSSLSNKNGKKKSKNKTKKKKMRKQCGSGRYKPTEIFTLKELYELPDETWELFIKQYFNPEPSIVNIRNDALMMMKQSQIVRKIKKSMQIYNTEKIDFSNWLSLYVKIIQKYNDIIEPLINSGEVDKNDVDANLRRLDLIGLGNYLNTYMNQLLIMKYFDGGANIKQYLFTKNTKNQ